MADESQAIEGYGCQCGYRSDNLADIRRHWLATKNDPPGTHKSLGRINLVTGDVSLPPWDERTKDEQAMSKNAVHKDGNKNTAISVSKSGIITSTRITENLSEASEIRFVPRILTATLTPIMQTAIVAAQREWRWRSDMPLINFLDTVIYNFFKEHGITLAAYVVDPSGGNDENGNGEEPIGETIGPPDGSGDIEVMTEPPKAEEKTEPVKASVAVAEQEPEPEQAEFNIEKFTKTGGERAARKLKVQFGQKEELN